MLMQFRVINVIWLMSRTRITAQNIFFNLRKIVNRYKWKNYVVVARFKFSVELDVLVIRE